jgi:peptidoglycan hydrolase-like protein with peptidoglycan-binding domain
MAGTAGSDQLKLCFDLTTWIHRISTPANDAWARNNAWAVYNANLRQIPTAENPNQLAARQNLLDQDRFIQRPQSSGRYNFQFSDNEIRSVQAALRRLGIYSGQADGILGPAFQEAQGLPATGRIEPNVLRTLKLPLLQVSLRSN